MKRLCLLLFIALSLCIFTSCNLLQNKEESKAEDASPANKTPEVINAEVEANNKEFKIKLDNIEKQYRAKREEAQKQFIEQNKLTVDKSEQERLQREKAENARFQEKLQFLYSAELSSVNLSLSTELKRINQEYEAEKDRIGKEYGAAMQKIKEEYNIRIQDISNKYMGSMDSSDQEAADLSKAEQAQLSQESGAKKRQISQEYTASLKKAEQEKAAQTISEQSKSAMERKYQSLSQSIEKVLKTYEDDILYAKTARDTAKASFKKESSEKYDASFNRLIFEKTTDTVKWESVAIQEIKELSDYYADQDKKYNDSVIKINKLKNEELSKLFV